MRIREVEGITSFRTFLQFGYSIPPHPRTVVFNRVKDWRWGRKIFLKELCLNDVRFHFEWFMLHILTKIFLKLHSNNESPLGHLFWSFSGLDKIMYLLLLALFLRRHLWFLLLPLQGPRKNFWFEKCISQPKETKEGILWNSCANTIITPYVHEEITLCEITWLLQYKIDLKKNNYKKWCCSKHTHCLKLSSSVMVLSTWISMCKWNFLKI